MRMRFLSFVLSYTLRPYVAERLFGIHPLMVSRPADAPGILRTEQVMSLQTSLDGRRSSKQAFLHPPASPGTAPAPLPLSEKVESL